MKRVNSNYHALHTLKSSDPKLRKAIISNCDKKLVYSISEFILKDLNGYVKLSGFNTRKLRKYKATIRNVADKPVPISSKNTYNVFRFRRKVSSGPKTPFYCSSSSSI